MALSIRLVPEPDSCSHRMRDAREAVSLVLSRDDYAIFQAVRKNLERIGPGPRVDLTSCKGSLVHVDTVSPPQLVR